MTDSNEELVAKLRGVDHMSVEDCFLQSPLFEKAATRIESLTRELAEAMAERDAAIGSRDCSHDQAAALLGKVKMLTARAERAESELAEARAESQEWQSRAESTFGKGSDGEIYARASHRIAERAEAALSPVTGAVDDAAVERACAAFFGPSWPATWARPATARHDMRRALTAASLPSVQGWIEPNSGVTYSAQELADLLAGRDKFIVDQGLWDDFVSALPSPPKGGDRP